MGQALHDRQHALPGRQHFTFDLVGLVEFGPAQNAGQCAKQFIELDVRVDDPGLHRGQRRPGRKPVTSNPGQLRQGLGGELEPLVLLQAANQLGAGVFVLVTVLAPGRARQQGARLDLGQHRRHQQVLAGQFDFHSLHQFHVLDVLVGDGGHIDRQDIQILPANQIEQQVKRSLEGLEKDPERLRGNVQILGQLGDRLIEQASQHLGVGFDLGARGRTGLGLDLSIEIALGVRPSRCTFLVSPTLGLLCRRRVAHAWGTWVAMVVVTMNKGGCGRLDRGATNPPVYQAPRDLAKSARPRRHFSRRYRRCDSGRDSRTAFHAPASDAPPCARPRNPGP